MKVFCLPPKENWVCDRFEYEWRMMNADLVEINPEKADIIWLLADWCWHQLPRRLLAQKKVICTVHHIVPNKFDDARLKNFQDRDQFVDLYHVPSNKTLQQVKLLTEKEIFCQPFWVNQSIWYNIPNKEAIRKKYNVPLDAYVIGSFQRDTEGFDLATPKLEKGPDIFVKYVQATQKYQKNVHVLLAGWRRQYVISELKQHSIPFTYIELPDFGTLNELYNALDLYVVGSRYEGGPQSIFECAQNKTPVVSTDVGAASDLLSKTSLFDADHIEIVPTDVDTAYKNVQKYLIPHGMISFRESIQNLNNGD